MGYMSYARSEMDLIGLDAETQARVLELVKIVGDEGHSGGSYMVFKGAFKRWAADPVEILDTKSLLYPLSEKLKVFDYQTRHTLAAYAYKFCSFIPLTPLTGSDDEWNEIGQGRYQNRRVSSIFKDEPSGVAYRIAMCVRCYPNQRYDGWVGYTRGSDRKDVIFPYDFEAEENKPETRYYSDEDCLLPEGTDPKAWLYEQQILWLSGVDPKTTHVREDVLFMAKNDLSRYTLYLGAYINHAFPDDLITDTLKSEAINNLCFVDTHDGSTWITIESRIMGTPLQVIISDTQVALRLARLVHQIPTGSQLLPQGLERYFDQPVFRTELGLEFGLVERQVRVLESEYTGWSIKNDISVLEFAPLPTALTPGPIYYDRPFLVSGSPSDYLTEAKARNQAELKSN